MHDRHSRRTVRRRHTIIIIMRPLRITERNIINIHPVASRNSARCLHRRRTRLPVRLNHPKAAGTPAMETEMGTVAAMAMAIDN